MYQNIAIHIICQIIIAVTIMTHVNERYVCRLIFLKTVEAN